MVRISEDGDRITPSHFDVRILIALLNGPHKAYQLARQIEADQLGGARISNGALLPALKRLERLDLVERLANRNYKLSTFGQSTATAEIAQLERLVRAAKDRA